MDPQQPNEVIPYWSNKCTMDEHVIYCLNPTVAQDTCRCGKLVAPSILKILQRENLIFPNQLVEQMNLPRAAATAIESWNRTTQAPILDKIIKGFHRESPIPRKLPTIRMKPRVDLQKNAVPKSWQASKYSFPKSRRYDPKS